MDDEDDVVGIEVQCSPHGLNRNRSSIAVKLQLELYTEDLHQ